MKVSRPLKRVLRISFSVLYAAGMTYWGSRSWLRVAGEFGEPKPHLLEKLAGPLHFMAAITFIFVLGMIWSQHISVSIHMRRHRPSGWAFLVFISALALSGTAFIYLNQDGIMKWVAQIHPIVGACLLPLLAFHWMRAQKTSKSIRRRH